MSTEQGIDKGGKVAEAAEESTYAIQSAATNVVEAMDSGILYAEFRDRLEHLRVTMAEARHLGVPETDIEAALEGVRQSHPDVTETWLEILEQMCVYVWLEDPDENRVQGNTVIIDRIIWENFDESEVLEDVIQQLHDDLNSNWEIVEPAKTPSAPPSSSTANSSPSLLSVDGLKWIVDETLGMVGKLTRNETTGEIRYFSKTGFPLLEISIYHSPDDGWQVGGIGQYSEVLRTLCQTVRKERERTNA